MAITDDDIREFQRVMATEDPSIELTFEEAKQRYHELLYLYWNLAHKPPGKGEPPYHPPPPPWV
jgi:hypothetical protein